MNGSAGTPGPPLPPHLDRPARQVLIDIAWESIKSGLNGGHSKHPPATALPEVLRQPGSSFVTLQRHGKLAGCIGSLEPVRSLADDVAHNAWSAAFADPRLPSVTSADLNVLDLKISVLGDLETLNVTSREQLTKEIEPGLDGLVVTCGNHRATFLPSVWEMLPTIDEFLDHLWEKAGISPRTWPPHTLVQRYRTIEFGKP